MIKRGEVPEPTEDTYISMIAKVILFKECDKLVAMATEHAARTEDPFVAFTTWQIRATIKAELNKLDDAEKSNRKAWNIA